MILRRKQNAYERTSGRRGARFDGGNARLRIERVRAGHGLRSAVLVSHRTVRKLGHPDRKRHERLPEHAQRARRRHQRRQDRRRGMRNRLQHRKGCGLLRVDEIQEPGHHQPVLDRHHLAAHSKGRGRQDPGAVDGLRPVGVGGRSGLPLGVQPACDLLGWSVDDHQVHRRQGRRTRQAQGQDHRLHLLRRRLRPRAAAAAGNLREEVRLRDQALSGAAGGNAEPVGPVA